METTHKKKKFGEKPVELVVGDDVADEILV